MIPKRLPTILFILLTVFVSACTKQETATPTLAALPSATPSPVSSPRPTNVILEPTSSPAPTFTLIPYTSTPAESVDASLITKTVGQEMSDGSSGFSVNGFASDGQIRMTLRYTVVSGTDSEIHRKGEYAGQRMPYAVCALKNLEVNVPSVLFMIDIRDTNDKPRGSYMYCVDAETIGLMNCSSPSQSDLSKLMLNGNCPIQLNNEGHP